jgi:rubrerythrin
MKNVMKFALLLSAILFIYGCGQKPVKTIENLKAAFNGESTASAKYAAFAEKAKTEGYDTVAVMFTAISKAEAIHAGNHLKVLEKLGEKMAGPEIGKFTVLTTAENLAEAEKGETYEIDVMYPEFIATARELKVPDAVKSFTWAFDTEKKHKAFYNAAIVALNSGGEKSVQAQWYICPVCGNTFDGATVPESCDFCLTKKEKFILA